MPEASPTLAEELTAALNLSGTTGVTPSPVEGETSAAPAVGTSAPVQDAVNGPSVADKGTPPPASSIPPELSFVPANLQSQFTSLNADAAAFLKAMHDLSLKGDRFTEKCQELSRKVEALDAKESALTTKAGKWEALVEDREAYDHLFAFLQDREARKNAPDEEDDDVDLSDPAARRAWKKRVEERAESKGRTAAESVLHEQLVAPKEREAKAALVLEQELVVRRGLDPTVARGIAREAYVHGLRMRPPIEPTLENVTLLVEPFVALAAAKAETNKGEPAPAIVPAPTALNGSVSVQRKVTPSLGGGAVAPPPSPAFVREGRPPSGRDEFQTSVLRRASSHFGKEITTADLDDALFNSWGRPKEE